MVASEVPDDVPVPVVVEVDDEEVDVSKPLMMVMSFVAFICVWRPLVVVTSGSARFSTPPRVWSACRVT